MSPLFYCVDCQRIFKAKENCQFCNSANVKELKRGTSVNVMGTKSKGQVLKIKDDLVSLILVTEAKDKVVKEFMAATLKKIL